MVYPSLVHGQRLRIQYSYGILHGWVKVACLSTMVMVEYYTINIAEQQQSVQQSHRAGGLNSNLLVLYFIVIDLQVLTALQIWAWHKVLLQCVQALLATSDRKTLPHSELVPLNMLEV